MILNNRKHMLPTLSRLSPVIVLVILLFNFIISPSYTSFYLFIAYILVIVSNSIIKNLISKSIYKLLNISSLPILGLGERPNSAYSCGFILDNKKSNSFGMQSGHSQIAWTVAIYIIARLIARLSSNKTTSKNTVIISIILVLLSALYISYSRVYIEGCHTVQQVIAGGLLGILSGFLIYYYEDDIIVILRKIYRK